MSIDWNAVATIAAPIIALFLGIWVNRRFGSRPVLVSYYSHVSVFLHRPAGGTPITVHTHSVVLRNTGHQSATNVRLHHLALPDFNLAPTVVHHIEDLPDGTKDIVIPILVPGEEVTVSYLYFPPLTFAGVNAGIKSDQGFAQAIPVLLQRQFSKWVNWVVGGLMLLGLITLVYLVYLLATAILR